jgi:hypothetical protein
MRLVVGGEGVMDEPSLAILDRWSRFARPYLIALAFALLIAFYPELGQADEQWSISRLPPVVEKPAAKSVVETAVARPAHGIETQPNAASSPQRGKALFPMGRTRLFGGLRTPAQEPSLLSPNSPAPATSMFDPAVRPASLQEPAKPLALAKVPQDPDTSKDSTAKPEDDAKDSAAGEKKDGQEPQTFGRKPESNALQFLRQQDVLLAQGAWQFDTGLIYTLFENNFPLPLFDQVTGDVNNVVDGLVRRRLLYTPLAARYGLTRNIQLSATLPMGWSNTQLSTFGASDSTNKGGIGDLTAGASFHLLKSEDQLPDVIATMDFTAPTGVFSTPIFGQVPGSNLGQGFWAMSGSLLFIHRYDPVIVFYGGGIRHLFEREFNGVLFSPGEQILYQFGVGFSVNDRVTFSTAFQGFYITNTQLDNVTIDGTNLEPISLRFAATIARNCRIIEPFVAIGATRSAPAVNFGLVVTLY